MFGQIGGMDTILSSVGSIFAGVFSAKLYMASLLSTFYYINKNSSIKKIVPNKISEENKEDIYEKAKQKSWESQIIGIKLFNQ